MAQSFSEFSFLVEMPEHNVDEALDALADVLDSDSLESNGWWGTVSVEKHSDSELWFSHNSDDGYGDITGACEIIQWLQRNYHAEQRVFFTWSFSCSKKRLGEFGGGAALVTADSIQTVATEQLADYFS